MLHFFKYLFFPPVEYYDNQFSAINRYDTNVAEKAIQATLLRIINAGFIINPPFRWIAKLPLS